MQVFKGPRKGKSQELNISQEAQQRVLIGLSWNPLSQDLDFYKQKNKGNFIANYFSDAKEAISHVRYISKSTKKDDLEGRDDGFELYDLDLYCYVYDKNKNFVLMLGPDAKDAIDHSGKTYHSGEDFSGLGGPDDEQIFIETKNLPDNYHHFVFVVTSDSKYSLDEVASPEIRIADSKTNTDLLRVSIDPPANLNAYAFVFGTVSREAENWTASNIGEYAAFDMDWENELKSHI